MTDVRTAGAIYDLGYQRYTGERLGRAAAIRSLYRYSLQTAFGLGRSDRAKSIPSLVMIAVFLPAVVMIGVASARALPGILQYNNYLEFTAFLLALFAATQAPELIVTDKQQGVLSLYLARPMRATDYAIAKLAALSTAMLVLTLGPQLMLFLGKVFVADAPWPAFVAEWPKLFPILGGALLTAVFIASIGLVLASFATRRGYATAGVIVFFVLTAAVVEMFRAVTSGALQRYAVLVHPVYLITGFANWLFDIEARRHSTVGRADLPGWWYLLVMVAACVASAATLLRRYRRIAV